MMPPFYSVTQSKVELSCVPRNQHSASARDLAFSHREQMSCLYLAGNLFILREKKKEKKSPASEVY